MKYPFVVGALAVGAFIAGVLYLKPDSADQSPATMQSAPGEGAGAKPAPPAAGAPRGSVSSQLRRADAKQVPSDPRLAALMVSPDNGLIEFVQGSDGKVIAEIDNDPGSPGFKKPLREYMYSGDQVIGLVEYRYLPAHVEIIRRTVSYKPDGSVDQYLESTSYQEGDKKAQGAG